MVLFVENKSLNKDVLNKIWSYISFKFNPHLLLLNKDYYIYIDCY